LLFIYCIVILMYRIIDKQNVSQIVHIWIKFFNNFKVEMFSSQKQYFVTTYFNILILNFCYFFLSIILINTLIS